MLRHATRALNVNNIHVVADESKKCQKMMEKFGWEKGKGLGRKEDGIKENIRANGNAGKKGFCAFECSFEFDCNALIDA